MLRYLRRISPLVWGLLFVVGVAGLAQLLFRVTGWLSQTTVLFVVQPLLALVVAGVIFYMTKRHHRPIAVRQPGDKAAIVASILAIWFVLYMLSGLATTYVHNALAASLSTVIINLIVFGSVAGLMEYARYRIMSQVRRSHLVGVGVGVAGVFALGQVASTIYAAAIPGAQQAIEVVVGMIIPAVVGSLLATYLAISSGLMSQLVYQLGVVLMTVLPPFIPKYDWYLLGVSSILLSVAIYIAIDRSSRRSGRRTRSIRHGERAYDVMLMSVMVALVLFVTGMFTYKPTVIMSNSMQPVFGRGSAVIVQRLEETLDIRDGDIIQYEHEGKLITHRVVAVQVVGGSAKQRIFQTQGDNSPSPDPVVQSEQVVGIVRASIPLVGYPTVWLRELGG